MTLLQPMRQFPPQTIDDVVGQDAAVATIRRRFASGNHDTPLMLYGPHGVGKATLARLYAKAMLCQEFRDDKALACGRCEFCRYFDDNPGFEFAEFDAQAVKKPRSVFRAKLAKTSLVDHRVFVIRGMESATAEFVDVLLKSMENENANVTFVLLSADIKGVRAAGQSRCMVQRLRPLTDADMKTFCDSAFRSLGCAMPVGEIVDAILAGCKGLPRLAANACYRIKNLNELNLKSVTAMVGVDWGEEAINYCFSLFDSDNSENSKADFSEEVDCSVTTARIRLVLSEMAHYITQSDVQQVLFSGFRPFRRDLMVQLAARFREQSALVRQPTSVLWSSVAEVYLREDYADPMGFALATRTARGLLRYPASPPRLG